MEKEKLLIVSIMTGIDPSYHYAKRSFLNYAQKCQADFLPITQTEIKLPKLKTVDFSRQAWAQKLKLGDFLSKYDRVLYVDADIVIAPTAPNIFELYSDHKKVYMFNEGQLENRKEEHEIINRFQKQNNENSLNLDFYYNAGVILISKESNFLALQKTREIDFFIDNSKYYEQTYFNYLIARHNVSHESIDEKFNRMIISGPKENRFSSYFIHHAGGSYSSRSKFKFLTLINDYCDLYHYRLTIIDKIKIFGEACIFYFRRYLKKALI